MFFPDGNWKTSWKATRFFTNLREDAGLKTIRFIPLQTLALLALACSLIAFAGCASNDQVDNVSERPWNDTQGWQGGLPSGINDGR